MHLENYLTRIGLAQPLPPNADTLRRLHIAHLAAFTFHNLGIQRRAPILVDVDSIERKFFAGPDGGGYCFEQNTLFGAALRELGFNVTTLLGRVPTPEKRLLNHMLLGVDIGGERWIADVGFGGEGPLEPIRLRDGERVMQNGIEYLVRRNGSLWSLSMQCGEHAQELYEFSEAPFTEGDVEIANYYISTHPESIFRRTLTIQHITPEERVILRPKVITRYRNGVREDTPIEPSQIRKYARELFGIELGEEKLLFED